MPATSISVWALFSLSTCPGAPTCTDVAVGEVPGRTGRQTPAQMKEGFRVPAALAAIRSPHTGQAVLMAPDWKRQIHVFRQPRQARGTKPTTFLLPSAFAAVRGKNGVLRQNITRRQTLMRS